MPKPKIFATHGLFEDARKFWKPHATSNIGASQNALRARKCCAA